MVFVGDAIARFGPRRVMLTGACCFGGAVTLLAVIDALWQLYLVYLLMAVGAATMHVGAISTVVGLWFEESAPLAISLALNGASSGGIFITPPLVLAIAAYGFSSAVLGATLLMAAVLLPAIAFWIKRPAGHRGAARGRARAAAWTRRSALRSAKFWSVAAPFALALTAQVGFLVHQIAILEPVMGRAQAGFSVAALTVMAIIGRFGLGAFANAPRHAAVRGMVGGEPGRRAAGDCGDEQHRGAVRRLRAVRAFGRKSADAAGADHPARVRGGLVRHAGRAVVGDQPIHLRVRAGPARRAPRRTGSYTAPLVLCAALDIAAAVLILLRPASARDAVI